MNGFDGLLKFLAVISVITFCIGIVVLGLLIAKPVVGGCLFNIASDGSCNTFVTQSNDGVPPWALVVVAVGLVLALVWPKGRAQ